MDREHADQDHAESAAARVTKRDCNRTFFKLFQGILCIFGLTFLIGTIVILVNNPSVVTDSKLQHMFVFILIFVVFEVFFPLLFMLLALTCKCFCSSRRKPKRGQPKKKSAAKANGYFYLLLNIAIVCTVIFSFVSVVWGFIIFSQMGSSLFQKYFSVRYYAVYILYWGIMAYSIFIILIYALQILITNLIMSPYCCEGHSPCGDLCDTNDDLMDEEDGPEEQQPQDKEMKEAQVVQVTQVLDPMEGMPQGRQYYGGRPPIDLRNSLGNNSLGNNPDATLAAFSR